MRYIVKNIDKTVQRIMDNQGNCLFLSPGESTVVTNPPKDSYIFQVEEVLEETEQLSVPQISVQMLLTKVEPFVQNKKVMTFKELKSVAPNLDNLDKEAKQFYNFLESYVNGKKVLSKSEFEKLKNEQNQHKEVKI